MLVYGTGFFVMEQISGDTKITRSKQTFFFYFLGLTNLMFNWGHHTYIVPAAGWIKNVSYIISMTELLIVGNIIWSWRKSISKARKNFHMIPYRFMVAADAWIFLNLILAILLSIPSINYYTHGTHITVAHAMGATIGINSMILFASIFYIGETINFSYKEKKIKNAFWITNISLLFFWLSLIGSGIVKVLEKEKNTAFQQMMMKLSPWFHAFTITGFGIFTGILLFSLPFFTCFFKKNISTEKMFIKEKPL
jgi:nitric oxide reductase subunit B